MIPFAAYNAVETPSATQWAEQPPKHYLFHDYRIGISTAIYYMVRLAHPSQPSNGSSRFAGHVGVTSTHNTNGQTHRQRYVRHL